MEIKNWNIVISLLYISDPDNLIAPHALGFHQLVLMQVQHYKPIVLPCRLTDPTANVTLRKIQWPEVILPIGEKHAILFDPQKGFYLQYPNSYFQGFFKCVAEKDGKTSIRNLQLYYLSMSFLCPRPERSPGGHLVFGWSVCPFVCLTICP